MKKSDYDNEKLALETEYEVKLARLNRKYALSNNIVKPGDIVSTLLVNVDVDEIKIIEENGYPSCLYIGNEVREKNGDFFHTGGAWGCVGQAFVTAVNGRAVK